MVFLKAKFWRKVSLYFESLLYSGPEQSSTLGDVGAIQARGLGHHKKHLPCWEERKKKICCRAEERWESQGKKSRTELMAHGPVPPAYSDSPREAGFPFSLMDTQIEFYRLPNFYSSPCLHWHVSNAALLQVRFLGKGPLEVDAVENALASQHLCVIHMEYSSPECSYSRRHGREKRPWEREAEENAYRTQGFHRGKGPEPCTGAYTNLKSQHEEATL